jgi:hypothetical protein
MGYDLVTISAHNLRHYVAHPNYVNEYASRGPLAEVQLNINPFFCDMLPRYCEIGFRCAEATCCLNLQRTKCPGRSDAALSPKTMKPSKLHLQHITNVTHSHHIYNFQHRKNKMAYATWSFLGDRIQWNSLGLPALSGGWKVTKSPLLRSSGISSFGTGLETCSLFVFQSSDITGIRRKFYCNEEPTAPVYNYARYDP